MLKSTVKSVKSLCSKIKKNIYNKENLPQVQLLENNAIEFIWTKDYPDKGLMIWLYDDSDYYVECLLTIFDIDKQLICDSEDEVLEVIKKYLSIRFNY